jgi:hypothetical protein
MPEREELNNPVGVHRKEETIGNTSRAPSHPLIRPVVMAVSGTELSVLLKGEREGLWIWTGIFISRSFEKVLSPQIPLYTTPPHHLGPPRSGNRYSPPLESPDPGIPALGTLLEPWEYLAGRDV